LLPDINLSVKALKDCRHLRQSYLWL